MSSTYLQRTADHFARLLENRPAKLAYLAGEMGITEGTLRRRLRDGDFRLSELEGAARHFRVSVLAMLPEEVNA